MKVSERDASLEPSPFRAGIIARAAILNGVGTRAVIMAQDLRITNIDTLSSSAESHPSVRALTLVAVDSLALVGLGYAAHVVWPIVSSAPPPWQAWQLVALMPLFILAYAIAGFYQGSGIDAIEMIRSSARQTSVVFLVIVSSAPVVHLHPVDGPEPLGAWWLPALLAVPLARATVLWWPASWRWWLAPLAIAHHDDAVGIETEHRLLNGRSQLAKRLADIVLASAGLVVALPVMAVAAVAIVLRDPGPILYAQFREGRDGSRFRMWKLRTMYQDAEVRLPEYLRADERARREWEDEFKITGDPRVLPGVGAFLRRWSLDECPQLWNVVRGDMSLVGPRALPGYHLDAFEPAFRAKRRLVRPGMTGLWQVMSRGCGAIRRQEALDSHYISNWSIWMDVFVLAKTVEAVVSGRGAR